MTDISYAFNDATSGVFTYWLLPSKETARYLFALINELIVIFVGYFYIMKVVKWKTEESSNSQGCH